MEPALPPNWRVARDSDGKEYYFNELTGETSWSVPEEGGKPAALTSGSPDMGDKDEMAESGEFAPGPYDGGMMVSSGGGGGGEGRSRSGSMYAELSQLVGERVLPRLIMIVLCSFVVMLQSSVELGRASGDGGTQSYGIAVGSISMGVTLGMLGMAKLKPQTFSNYVIPKIPGELTILQSFAVFLFVWWVPGAIVLTFFAPFRGTSNAYFATWAALIASLLVLADTWMAVGDKLRALSTSRIHTDGNARSLVAMTLASILVFFASFEYVGEGVSQGTYALIVSMISACLSALTFFLTEKQKIGLAVKKAIAATLVINWIIAAIILTFDQPFTFTSNGFFGTWFATYFAVTYCWQIFGGGDFELSRGAVRALSFISVEDVREERGERLDSVAGPAVVSVSSGPAAPIPPSSNVA